jgi:hypothetical protein
MILRLRRTGADYRTSPRTQEKPGTHAGVEMLADLVQHVPGPLAR